ncbi:DUF4158 domain-containing protein [Streptomyces sp. NBC_01381]|uniref:DUF4158 domain-containing protein n=1 Tax=Streptomyces sp. NBC_01381 TaxID=2903845 RepID=UPI002250E47D|nr:DUF4158 domain-containing protein [Streptomyces sp. NBC_01381]MCX4672594.1 DUF4158 domain-containing protein [Streptomyces sp. NBC_01381]
MRSATEAANEFDDGVCFIDLSEPIFEPCIGHTSRAPSPAAAVEYVAQQVDVPAEAWADYDWQSKAIQRHRGEIRAAYGFRANTEEDQDRLAGWPATELCPVELSRDRLAAAVVARCRNDQIEPPAPGQVRRLVGKAVKDFEKRFCRSTVDRLSHATRSRLEDLIGGDGTEQGTDSDGVAAGAVGRTSPS